MSEDAELLDGCLDSIMGSNPSGITTPSSNRVRISRASSTARGTSTPVWEKMLGTEVLERRRTNNGVLLGGMEMDGCLGIACGLVACREVLKCDRDGRDPRDGA